MTFQSEKRRTNEKSFPRKRKRNGEEGRKITHALRYLYRNCSISIVSYSTSHSCLNFNRVISRPATNRFLAISFARRFMYGDNIDQMISPKPPVRLLGLTARLCHPFTLMPHYLKFRRMDEQGKIDLHARSDKGSRRISFVFIVTAVVSSGY